jgi:D-alanyl-D-alanine carboxypeptidase
VCPQLHYDLHYQLLCALVPSKCAFVVYCLVQLAAAHDPESGLGSDATLKTSFWLAGRTLAVRGGGDPTLTYSQLLGAAEHHVAKAVGGQLLQELVVDVSRFGRCELPGSWDWSYFSSTSGFLPSALVVGESNTSYSVS